MTREIDITDKASLEVAAKELLRGMLGQATGKAKVLALYGELGAGKTTFVQTMGKLLGVGDTITSPTFVVMKKYPLSPDSGFGEMVHIDAYRIESVDEMRVLGFAELCGEKGTIICIEWAGKIAELLPPDTTHLFFTEEGGKRLLKIRESNGD